MNRKLLLVLALVMILSLALVACGGGESEEKATASPAAQSTEPPSAVGDAAKGKEPFSACAACHGPNGEGVEGLGKSFAESEFVRDSSDEELLAFVKKGRPPGDEANSTGVDMPPKGGSPALTDEGLLDIIAHIRTLQ